MFNLTPLSTTRFPGAGDLTASRLQAARSAGTRGENADEEHAAGMPRADRLAAQLVSIATGRPTLTDPETIRPTSTLRLARLSRALQRMQQLSVQQRHGPDTESFRARVNAEYRSVGADFSQQISQVPRLAGATRADRADDRAEAETARREAIDNAARADEAGDAARQAATQTDGDAASAAGDARSTESTADLALPAWGASAAADAGPAPLVASAAMDTYAAIDTLPTGSADAPASGGGVEVSFSADAWRAHAGTSSVDANVIDAEPAVPATSTAAPAAAAAPAAPNLSTGAPLPLPF